MAEVLTRAEVEGLRDYAWSLPIIHTIKQMAELLEKVLPFIDYAPLVFLGIGHQSTQVH